MTPPLSIIDFDRTDQHLASQAAQLLVTGFKTHWPAAWPDLDSALKEIDDIVIPANIHRIAVDDNRNVMGWAGALSQYAATTWELHPLVIQPEFQSQGLGICLLNDLEAQVQKKGG
jgi:aminoglycoside 6'-N-acetyltransferase I